MFRTILFLRTILFFRCTQYSRGGNSSCYTTSTLPFRTATAAGNTSNHLSVSRASSVREARATTEERTLSSSGIYRHSSFTERSYRRRAESLSRQTSFSRTSRYVSANKKKNNSFRIRNILLISPAGLLYCRYCPSVPSQYSTDYVSASRRTSLFDGYSGFAIYSSISQGLSLIHI